MTAISLNNNYLTSLPTQIASMTLLNYSAAFTAQGNYMDCSKVNAYLPSLVKGTIFCSDQNTCQTSSCTSGVPVCHTVNGECVIKCGTQHYRYNNKCYFCSEMSTVSPQCTTCSGGSCSKCTAGYGLSYGVCKGCTGNTYNDGTTLACQVGKANCEISHTNKSFCNQCISGLVPDSLGVCVECEGNFYSTNGVNCVKGPDNCVECETSRSYCIQCAVGYEQISGKCSACKGNTFNDGTSVFCKEGPANCADSKNTESFCEACIPGMMPDAQGQCILCTGNTYSDDGTLCKEGQKYCITSEPTRSYCTKCIAGKEPIEGVCTDCKGNTFNDGTTKMCQQGPDNCSKSNTTEPYCEQCVSGFVPENGKCIECGNETYSSDGLECVASTIIENCLSYRKTEDKCMTCDKNLRVSHDNKCRLCIDGEFTTDTECVPCPSGTYSVVGSACTSECSEFTSHLSICLETGFCKLQNGKCISVDDNTVLIVSITCGVLGFLIIAGIVVVIVLRKVGWFDKKREEWEQRIVADADMTVFENTDLDVGFGPQILTFEGQQPAFGEEIKTTLTLTNKTEKDVRFVVPDQDKSVLYKVWAKTQTGIIPKNQSVEINIYLTRFKNKDIRSTVRVCLFPKNKEKDGREMRVPFLLPPRPEFDIRPTEVKIEQQIGEGSYGIVSRGKYQDHDVAIKELKVITNDHATLFKREIEVMSQVLGPNVVKFFGSYVGRERMFHVTEYMDLGNLTSVMATHSLSPRMKMKVLCDISLGMVTIHSFNVIHRDLKPDNVLCKSPFDENNQEVCKITDFGTSRALQSVFAITMTKGQGTPLFMAPEILSGQTHYSRNVDIYSFAIMMWSIIMDGKRPYEEYSFSSQLELQNAIVTGMRPTLTEKIPRELCEVMTACWVPQAAQRPPFTEIHQRLKQLHSQTL